MARLFPAALPFLFFLLLRTLPNPASCEVVLEYGYTVTTVFDGNKIDPPVHPFSLLPRTENGDSFLLLDSSGSAFYILSRDGKVNPFSGNGGTGYLDGNVAAAQFKHPRSFAVDSKGNVYVADKNNRVIRKIARSGVTTIAGGYSNSTGHTDGPAQNATFSNDFYLTFIPKICALLISDRANSLVRQIYLKPEDCAHESRLEMGWPWVSVIGFLCLLVGSVAGFVARPYLTSRDMFSRSRSRSRSRSHNVTWSHCWTSLSRRLLTVSSDNRNVVASLAPVKRLGRFIRFGLSIIFLILRVFGLCIVGNPSPRAEPVSMLYVDAVGKPKKKQDFADQLKDLMSLDGGLVECSEITKVNNAGDEKGDSTANVHERIDKLIEANILHFTNQPAKQEGSVGLVKRRGREADDIQ